MKGRLAPSCGCSPRRSGQVDPRGDVTVIVNDGMGPRDWSPDPLDRTTAHGLVEPRSEAQTRRLKPATRGRFTTGFSSSGRRTACGQVLPATNGNFTAAKRVEPMLGCRAASENFGWQLRVAGCHTRLRTVNRRAAVHIGRQHCLRSGKPGPDPYQPIDVLRSCRTTGPDRPRVCSLTSVRGSGTLTLLHYRLRFKLRQGLTRAKGGAAKPPVFVLTQFLRARHDSGVAEQADRWLGRIDIVCPRQFRGGTPLTAIRPRTFR